MALDNEGEYMKTVAELVGESVLVRQQVKLFGPRPVEGYGVGATIRAKVRFDDVCENGHNTFSITGSVRVPGEWEEAAGGYLHGEIAVTFPELAPLLKWHLCSTDGPLHYVANTCWFAGDRDCWGRQAGEVARTQHVGRFGTSPIEHRIPGRFWAFLQNAAPYDFEVLRVDHRQTVGPQFDPKFTFGGYEAEWHECPFDTEHEALNFLRALQTERPQFVEVPIEWSQGKPRELDTARDVAIWPDATDEELIAPGLKTRLLARLPALLAEFRAAVEGLGFVW